MKKNKVLYLNSAFTTKELSSADEPIDSIYIEGLASTSDVDRMGDVIPPSVWERGMENYLKNPIILAYHEHDDPCGRMTDHKITDAGLWIKARISAAAEVFDLVRDGILTAFSVGFRIKDAEYNAAAEVFLIKEVELIEISVVSVPANQNTLFSLSKAFKDAEEYKQFKEQFVKMDASAKELETSNDTKSSSIKEWNMDPKELQAMLDKAAKDAAEQATKAILDAQAAEKAKKEADAKAQAELDAKIKSAVEASVTTVSTGAEDLLKEITKRLEDSEKTSKTVLEGLEATIKEKAEELAKIQSSKMNFSDKSVKGESTYEEREKAFLLSKVSGKAIDQTKYGQQIITKAGPHVPSATWELEVSMNMEAEVRRRLVVAPLLRNITMQTNVMTLPVNPEAGYGTWITNAQFGTDDSSGAAQTHALKDITLNAYKLATREYMNYEEEEDSLLVLLPIVRDAMVRRTAKSVDLALLRGAGAGADPVKGLCTWDAASAVTVSTAAKVDVEDMRALRKDLGAWGLTPSELIYIVSTDVYYDLLDDTNFQTMDKVGPQATFLTGQIGQIAQTPVLVSAEFATKGAGARAAVCFHPGNFIVGNQRGLRFDTQELVETQRRVLVASLRTGMTQVTTNLGGAVSALEWS
jgi:HK97 family phage prohead protease/HK97 family phage major capsid protein